MTNEPLAFQLTVRELRDALAQADENAIVAFALPAGFPSNPDFETLINVRLDRVRGPVVRLVPVRPMTGEGAV